MSKVYRRDARDSSPSVYMETTLLATNKYDLFLAFAQQAAAASMTDVAEYINEMKRLHENALRVQEILGSIEDLEVMSVCFVISQ